MARNVVSGGLLLLLCNLGLADGIGRVGPGRVAIAVAEVNAADMAAATLGEQLLSDASRARVGMRAVGMQKVPLVGGPKISSGSPGAVKIVDPGASWRFTLRGKVRLVAKRLVKCLRR